MPFLSYSVIPIFKNCETSAQASPLQRKNFAIGVNILIISSLLCSSNKKYIPMGQTIIFDKVSMSKQTANLSGCTLFRAVLAIPISPINTKRKIIFRIHLSMYAHLLIVPKTIYGNSRIVTSSSAYCKIGTQSTKNTADIKDNITINGKTVLLYIFLRTLLYYLVSSRIYMFEFLFPSQVCICKVLSIQPEAFSQPSIFNQSS